MLRWLSYFPVSWIQFSSTIQGHFCRARIIPGTRPGVAQTTYFSPNTQKASRKSFKGSSKPTLHGSPLNLGPPNPLAVQCAMWVKCVWILVRGLPRTGTRPAAAAKALFADTPNWSLPQFSLSHSLPPSPLPSSTLLAQLSLWAICSCLRKGWIP